MHGASRIFAEDLEILRRWLRLAAPAPAAECTPSAVCNRHSAYALRNLLTLASVGSMLNSSRASWRHRIFSASWRGRRYLQETLHLKGGFNFGKLAHDPKKQAHSRSATNLLHSQASAGPRRSYA